MLTSGGWSIAAFGRVGVNIALTVHLGSIITACVTPFDADGEVDLVAARGLMRHLVDHGSDGLVVAGTTGESPTLDDEEKLLLFEAAVDEVGGRATVIAGTGSNDTRHSVELTRRASELGVDGVLVVCPYYNKPPEEGVVAHFEAIASSTDLPVVIYNIPGRCVINIEPRTFGRLAGVGNIVAVKQANADLDQAREIVEDGRLALYAGDDGLTLPFLELGGAGVISVSSHVVGDRMQDMVAAVRRGDLEGARRIDAELRDVYEALFVAPNPIPAKAAMRLLGFDVGGCRLPLVDPSADVIRRVGEMLDRHGLLQPREAAASQ